jgi:arsenate reductase (thioredoxin)
MPRVLILCTHNSARSQMAEGWVRHHAAAGAELEIWSAGTERTTVKPEAVTVMAEVGIDLGSHTSKRLDELPDPWAFDVVLTVCDEANETCPTYPARTRRLHVPMPDPSGEPLPRWRAVRDAIGAMSARLVGDLASGSEPDESALRAAATPASRPTNHG